MAAADTAAEAAAVSKRAEREGPSSAPAAVVASVSPVRAEVREGEVIRAEGFDAIEIS